MKFLNSGVRNMIERYDIFGGEAGAFSGVRREAVVAVVASLTGGTSELPQPEVVAALAAEAATGVSTAERERYDAIGRGKAADYGQF
jgi:hypothetical protein